MIAVTALGDGTRMHEDRKVKQGLPCRHPMPVVPSAVTPYSRSRISSMATLPPFSTVTILWIGLKPVDVMSMM